MTPGRLRDPRWVPLVAGPAVGVISVVESLTAPDFRPFLVPIAVVASWLVVGLVLQTRWPAAGAVITGGFYPVGAALGLPGLTGAGLIALLLACGCAGFAASRFRSWLAVALVTATIIGTELVVHGPSWDMIFLPTVFVVGLAGGRLLSRERVRSTQLLELTRQLDAQREAAERAAVTDERTRISREIHDSVAHSVSVMTLQTGGLRRQLGEVLRDRPQETEILLGLERLGRETVEELRSLVGILRDPDHGEPATTVPSLSRAVELVNDVRAAGLPVELVVAGEPAPLPRALDLSAYRILQEALTNVLRHAPGSPTRVTISYGHDAVDLKITNQTTTAVSGSRSAGGQGLVGMGQRAQLFGGTCTAGPVVDGFEVAAHLPSGGSADESDQATGMISVLLVDDEAMIRVGLRMVLSSEPDLEVVGEAADGAAAAEVAARLQPDVCLMDIRMPRVDGIAGARRVLEVAPDTRVVILTTFDEDAYLHAALQAGVSGFLLKVASPERLIEAVRTVASGGGLLDPAVTVRVIEAFATAAPTVNRSAALDRLTERERDVLRHVGRGLSNAEIAAALYLGETTVKTHVSNVLAKLGVRDRVQAVVAAYELGLIRPGKPEGTGSRD